MNQFIVQKTQPQLVREHLLAGKTITPAQAFMVYGISRLAAVIEVLRQDKTLEIDTVMREDEAGKKYAAYSLRKPITIGSAVQVKAGAGVGLPRWCLKSAASKVAGLYQDTAFVRFRRDNRDESYYLNVKELVNVG